MEKKVFIFIAGTLLLSPVLVALCCGTFLSITFALLYGGIMWFSPKFNTRIKRFWRTFWRVNLEMTKYYEVRE